MRKHVLLFDVRQRWGQISGRDQQSKPFSSGSTSIERSSLGFSVIFIPGDEAKQFKDHILNPETTSSPIPPE